MADLQDYDPEEPVDLMIGHGVVYQPMTLTQINDAIAQLFDHLGIVVVVREQNVQLKLET